MCQVDQTHPVLRERRLVVLALENQVRLRLLGTVCYPQLQVLVPLGIKNVGRNDMLERLRHEEQMIHGATEAVKLQFKYRWVDKMIERKNLRKPELQEWVSEWISDRNRLVGVKQKDSTKKIMTRMVIREVN